MNLAGIDLSDSKLPGANFTGSDLRHAQIVHSDWSEVALCGASMDCADISRTNLGLADLEGVRLRGADLTGSTLWRANLRHSEPKGACLALTNLDGADLLGAGLVHAILRGAHAEQADFSRANLLGANFTTANLRGAKFVKAYLEDAVFDGAEIRETLMGGAVLAGTHLTDVNLEALCDVGFIDHQRPSYVDSRSIILSLRVPRLKEFLQRTGMPEVFAEYMIDCARSLDPQGVFKLLQSTFISYGGPDTDFAQKLNDALLRNGVTTFFFAKDAIPGKKLHRVTRDGVNQHDRVILVCSKASLDRPGVVNEITETLQREARDGRKEYLIPITLDDHVFSGWKPDDPGVAQAIHDRVVADFRGAGTDKEVFDEGVMRLIAALKK